ncbi:Serine/threonine-protein kinase smg1, partial [Modicella reniformis]
NRTSYDFEAVKGALEGIQVFLDNAKDCKELLPVLEQLVALSGQHPGAWKPYFKVTSMSKHDVLSSFSVQWRDVTSFGQDLLEYFVKDIEVAATESTTSNPSSSIDTARLLLSCFTIISKALIAHALQGLDRIGLIQQRTMNMLVNVGNLSRRLDSEELQILASWKPRIHPKVTLDVVHPKGDMMRLRWLLPMTSIRAQHLLDTIMSCVPERTKNTPPFSDEHPELTLLSWSGVMCELENILPSLGMPNKLSETTDLNSVIEAADASYLNELEQSRLAGAKYHGAQRPDCRRTGAFTMSLISNMTFDTLLIVEMARLWPEQAALIFIRLLGTLVMVSEPRLPVIVHALKEVSARDSAISKRIIGLAAMDRPKESHIIKFSPAYNNCRSFDMSPVASEAWRRAVLQANPFLFAFQCYSLQETDITRALKILVLRSPNSGIFRYPHFSAVLSALTGNGEDLEQLGSGYQNEARSEQSGDMLQRLFHSCQGKDILSRVNADLGTDIIASEQVEIFQHSLKLLSYWSLWETARYCVLSRLRTPFGGPQQTLDALEKHLNGLLQASQKDTTGSLSLSRLRSFLMFLDRLELQFLNAQQGTALGMIPLTPKPSIIFVRSNKKMLDEWFSRVRGRAIEGAKAAGEHEIVIRNGYMMLAEQFSLLSRGSVHDILLWLGEFERVLVDLVEALIAKNASDAISGLYIWCRRAIRDMTKQSSSAKSKQSRSERSAQYPRYRNACLNDGQALALSQISLDWISTAVLHAQNRYEQSTKEAMSQIGSLIDNDNIDDVSFPAEFLCQGITNSLSDLSSYRQLQTFMDRIPIETYANETMLWSEDPLTQSLKEFCAREAKEAWKCLEEFYETRSKNLVVPDTFAFDRSGLIGRNFLFASRVHQQAGLQFSDLDNVRQQARQMIEPSAEFLLYNGLEYAGVTLVDTLMLNTATAVTPKVVKEFVDHLTLIPEEMRVNMFNKDLRYWVRLDALVNLAKRHTSNEDSRDRKQSNEFKFLLSRIARRSECHAFASNIPRTWEGDLSPEIEFEEAKAAMAKNDYSTALNAAERILDKIRESEQTLEDNPSAALFQSKIYLKTAKWSRLTKPALTEDNAGL